MAEGGLVEAVQAAESALGGDAVEGVAAVAEGARMAARVGARRTAASLLERGAAKWPGREELELVRAQIAAGAPWGATRAEWDVERALRDGRLDDARESLAPVLALHPVPAWARRAEATLALREERFADAARAWGAVAEGCEDPEEAARLRLSVALSRWAAGEPEALDAIRALRDATAEATTRGEGEAHGVAAAVVRSLERDPDRTAQGPAWLRAELAAELPAQPGPPARAALGLALAALGREGDGELEVPPAMAHLRRSLDRRGIPTLRVKADAATVEAVLRAGALLVIEEERPTESGFPFVAAWEPVAELFLLRDPERGEPELLDAASLRRRMRLFGDAALVIAGEGDRGAARLGALAEAGVTEDPTALAVDRCLVDEDGGLPPRARIAALAEEALAGAQDAAMLWRVRGEALLDSARAGRVQLGGGPFEPWYADARTRFPDAEWPFQLYAQALEIQQRWEEAAIAWLDAASRDWDDHRNALGAARARIGFGDVQGAERAVGQALRLDPGNVEALARGALLASWRGDHALARVRSDLATELAPDDPLALAAATTVLERADALADATERLRAAAPRLGPTSALSERLVHRLVHDGAWEEARAAARARCEAMPGDPDAWALLTRVAWGAADVDEAMGAANFGVRNAGPSESLVLATTDVLATLLDDAAASETTRGFTESLAGFVPDALLDVADRFARRGRLEAALEESDLAARAMPDRANVPWRTAQLLLDWAADDAESVARARALLEDTIGRADHFGPARVVLGWVIVDDDAERAVQLATHPAAAASPGLSWPLLATALERRGAADEAARVRERLAALDPEAIRSGLGLLSGCRLLGRCRDVLAALAEGAPDRWSVSLALAHGQAGDRAEELRLLSSLLEKDPDGAPLWAAVAAAEAAGDWGALARFAERAHREGRRVSGADFADVWVEAGRHAGALAAAGEGGAREALLSRAGRHPLALWALARVEQAAGGAHAQEDADRLAGVAPGAFAAMAGGARP